MTDNPFATHEVFNQVPPPGDVNLFTADAALREAVAREGADWAADDLARYGAIAGSARGRELGRLANEHLPVLRRYDAQGRRLDVVEFHPAWHEVMAISTGAGLNCLSWEHLGPKAGAPTPGRTVARVAGIYMAQQMEPGHCCPVTMTNAAVPTLMHQPEIAAEWLPRTLVRDYDPAFAPAGQKRACIIGMGMTEKQGGTDVRANTTRAEPAAGGGPGGEYLVTGHKWFLSAPMCDAFLILAQAPGGLTCLLMPRFLPDGSVNPIRIERLKDKLGNRSNASSEIELWRTHAWAVGEEGRGIATILEMVTLTRLDCAAASAGLMRQALASAVHHTRHRTVFQKRLIDQPLMARVLADMALDQEAAVALAMRLAGAFDRAGDDAGEAAFARVMTPAIKYWVCKITPAFVYEALECHGGNGFVEEGHMARLYREAPLNAIWEGSGNVMCLDVLRAIERTPAALDAVFDEIGRLSGGDRRLAAHADAVRALFADRDTLAGGARAAVERLVCLLAAALLHAHGPAAAADAFAASRLDGPFHHTWGTAKADTAAVLARFAAGE